MRTLREWLARLGGALRVGRRDSDLEEELRLHLELAAEEAQRRGADPEAARRAARLELGGSAQALEALRDQRGWPWLEDLARDIRYALRVLRRSPLFALVAILTLALGIGANAAIVHLIDTLSVRRLPIVNPHALAEVRADGIDGFGINAGPNGRVTYPLWRQIEANQGAFAGIFAWGNAGGLVVRRGMRALPADGIWVSGHFFRTLGIGPARGRLIVPEDDSPGCGEHVAVVSHDFWQSSLGGAESVVGSTLTVVDRPYTVVGVAPAGFTGLEVGRSFDVALPLCSALLSSQDGARRDLWWLRVMGRLEPGWSVAAADAHLRATSPGMLEATVPEGYSAELLAYYRALQFGAVPAGRGVSRLRDTHGTSLSLLLALTGLVLLITCGNLATLMLARAGAREREIAMRVAMGAPRRRLVSQMVVESVLVAAAGAAVAVPVAVLSARTLVTFLDTPDNPIRLTVAADWRMIAFVAAAAVFTTLLFGLVPALRVSMVDPLAATRQTSRGLTVDRHRARLRRALVAAQIALSLVLVVSALLFVRSFRNLSAVELGFDPDRVVVATFYDLGRFPPSDRRVAFQQELTAALRSLPGVAAAASSTHLLMSGSTFSHFFRLPDVSGDATKVARFAYVGPEYFETLRIPILAGRGFDHYDDAAARRVLLVNESFVRQHFGTGNAIGARVRTIAEGGYPETTYEIVGLVGNTKYAVLRDEECFCDAGRESMPPMAYVPNAQESSPPPLVHVVTRVSGALPDVIAAITRHAETLDPGVGVQVGELAPRIHASLSTDRALAWLAGAFGALAVALVVVGLYGVIAYLAVSRRTEIGIRLSLGSTRRHVVGLVLRDSIWLLAAGALAGLPLAVLAMRGAGTLLFGVSATDPPTLLGATATLALAACLAGGVPAWRAALLHPMAAIRDDPESMWRTARVKVQQAVRELSAGQERNPATPGTIISDVAGAIHRSASFPDAVDTALASLRERVGARFIVLLARTPDGRYRCAEWALPADGLLVGRLKRYPHPLPITANDLEAWRRWAQELAPAHVEEVERLAGTGARIAVPLRTRHELVGVLLLGAPEGRDDFTAAQVQLLSNAAEVFALLLENARLNVRELEQEKLQRDLALAAEVQRRLLPSEPPRCPGATFAAFTLPARTVGGDYYDFLDLPDARIGIAVADVAGKGIAAALLTSALHASLRVMTAEHDLVASQLAAQMNRFLYGSTRTSSYATFFYAQLDPRTRRLHYVNAGHNPPYLVRRAGAHVEITELSTGGMVLGLFPEVGYEDGAIDLQPGDRLVAFTDGVPDARDATGEELGEERVKDLLRDAVAASAEEIASTLAARVRAWIGGAEQHDDVTFIVVSLS